MPTTQSTLPPDVLDVLSHALAAAFRLGYSHTQDEAEQQEAQRLDLHATWTLLDVLAARLAEVPA